MLDEISFSLSKEDWEKIGSEAGWIKKAMAQPFSQMDQRELANNGIFTIDFGAGLKDFPKGGIKEYDAITEKYEIFKGKEQRQNVRKMYFPKEDNIVVLDGQEFFLAHVVEPTKKLDGKIFVFGPVVRNEEGEIDYSQINPQVQEKSYNQYESQIESSIGIKQRMVKEVNKFVDKYNKFVDKISGTGEEAARKGFSVTTLPLLVKWAETSITDRLNSLNAILNKKTRDLSQIKEIAKRPYESLLSGATSSNISPKDYALLLLERKFHATNSLEELLSQIQSESFNTPFSPEITSQIKGYLIDVINWQIATRKAEKAKGEADFAERSERMESDLSEMENAFLQKVKNIDISEVPGKGYKKSTGFFGPEFIETQKHETKESIELNMKELTEILNAIIDLREYIIDLPSKKNKIIRENPEIIDRIKGLSNQCKKFAAGYKEPPFISEGGTLKINKALFGKQNTLGNALIALVLRKLTDGIDKEIVGIMGNVPVGAEKTVAEPTAPPTTEIAPVASDNKEIKTASCNSWTQIVKNKNDKTIRNNQLVKQMSETLWNAFDRRTKLR